MQKAYEFFLSFFHFGIKKIRKQKFNPLKRNIHFLSYFALPYSGSLIESK